MHDSFNLLTEFKFVGKISKMGNNKVIWIPKEFHDKISNLEGKQVRILIDDNIQENLKMITKEEIEKARKQDEKEREEKLRIVSVGNIKQYSLDKYYN